MCPPDDICWMQFTVYSFTARPFDATGTTPSGPHPSVVEDKGQVLPGRRKMVQTHGANRG